MSESFTPKNFNYSPVSVTGSYEASANVYNVIYGNSATDSTITLPNVMQMLQGAPFLIKNFGVGTITVVDSNDTEIAIMTTSNTLMLLADPIAGIWQNTLGPIGGGSTSGVTGPPSSTNNAIAIWNGTGGSVLANSSIVITGGNTITTTSGDLNLDSFTGVINLNGANLTNVGTISQGAQTTAVGSRISITGASSATILAINTAAGNSYSGFITCTMVNDTNGTDNGTYWALFKIKNIGGTVTFSLSNVSRDIDTSIAGVVIATGVSGNMAQLNATGVVATTIAFQASAYITSTNY